MFISKDNNMHQTLDCAITLCSPKEKNSKSELDTRHWLLRGLAKSGQIRPVAAPEF